MFSIITSFFNVQPELEGAAIRVIIKHLSCLAFIECNSCFLALPGLLFFDTSTFKTASAYKNYLLLLIEFLVECNRGC